MIRTVKSRGEGEGTEVAKAGGYRNPKQARLDEKCKRSSEERGLFPAR